METTSASEVDTQPTESTRRVVPKFSSFKPLKEDLPPASLVPKDETKGSRQEHHEHRKHRSRTRDSRGDRKKKDKDRKRDPDERRHDRDKERDRDRDQGGGREQQHRDKDREQRRHRHHKSISPSRTTTAIAAQKTRSPSPDSWDAPKKQYYMDTRGDPSNVTYGTIYRYEIPDYRRHGSGCVVGLSPDIRIDREKGDGKGLVLTSKKDMKFSGGGKSSRYTYARNDNDGVKMLRIKKDGDSDDKAFETGLDFVPISSKLKGKKRKNHPDAECESSEEDDNHYRSIEGLKKVDIKPEDRDLEYASCTDSDKDFITSIEWIDRRRNSELIKKVDANPQDVDIWMEYVNHQDTLLSSNGRKPKLAERRSIAEVKLDILSKALEKCPGDERLLVKYMDVAETLWDPKRLLLKWQQILKENPAIIGLWTKYINFRQTDFQSFTYPECIKSFTECLVVLRSAVFRLGKDDTGSADIEKLEDIILYVFLRTTLFMREAGYVELAIASFQCMLELNVFNPLITPPPNTEAAHEQLLGKLEEFWDSEVIRIGELGAKGWATYVVSGGNGDVPEPREEKPFSGPLDHRDIFGSWMDDEEERLALSMMPARTIDEVEEDDPYRVILFSDFKALMFCFSVDAVRRKIVDAFLTFSNLTPARPVSSNSPGVTDTFLRNDMSSMEEWYLDEWFWPKGSDDAIDSKMITYLEELSMEPERKSGLSKGNPFGFGLKNCPIGQASLFTWESINWSQSVKGVDAAFVGRTLKMLVDGFEDEKLAAYYLAWISRNQPESVTKVAKALLKKFRTSLLLWNGFAQVEWQDGKIDAARNIFTTTLGMSQGFPEASRRDAILLWRTWAWKELEDPPQTIRILLSIESGKLLPEDKNSFSPKNIQPALLLKARRYLDDQQNFMMSMGHNHHAVIYVEVRALLEYFSHDQDISVALSIFDTFMEELERRDLTGSESVVHELCLMAKVQMLYYHARTAKMFKMKIMRDVLEQAVRLFPNNIVFMGLYAWNEGKTKIENKVRTLVRDVVLKEGRETVLGWVFAIWAELRMTGIGGGYNPHAVRSLFEQAVECNRTKSNIGLWITYVNFELREKEPRRAKETLFRGIQCCPWSKNLVLLAFKKLRPVLGFDEMRKILSIISSEKELRVHDVTELEDIIGEMSEAQRERLGRMGKPHFLDIPNDISEDEHMQGD